MKVLSDLTENGGITFPQHRLPVTAGNYLPGIRFPLLSQTYIEATANTSTNTTYYYPFVVAKTFTPTHFSLRRNANAYWGTCRLALYSDNDCQPGTRLWQSSATTSSGTNTFIDVAVTGITIEAGVLYWLAFRTSGATSGFVAASSFHPTVLLGYGLSGTTITPRFYFFESATTYANDFTLNPTTSIATGLLFFHVWAKDSA